MGSYLIYRTILLFIVGIFEIFLFDFNSFWDFFNFKKFFLVCSMIRTRDQHDGVYSFCWGAGENYIRKSF